MEYPSILDKLFINIAALRKEKALTQQALADRLGVKNTTVSNWEKRVACPQIVELIGLSNEFGVSLDSLVFGSHDEAASASPSRGRPPGDYVTRSELESLVASAVKMALAQKGEHPKRRKAG